jgi:hypothetical protein
MRTRKRSTKSPEITPPKTCIRVVSCDLVDRVAAAGTNLAVFIKATKPFSAAC